MQVHVDKFASATVRVPISNPVTVGHRRRPRVGDVIVVRALTENPVYPHVELVDGRRSVVKTGEVIAGVVGSRQALRGFVGRAPETVSPGEELHLLNMGGVVGRFVDGAPDLGHPIRVQVLGMAIREGEVINIAEGSIRPLEEYAGERPIILVIGTCMNVGKTATVTRLISRLTGAGRRVAAAKLSGVAALRDTESMREAGAVRVLSFLDCGYPSTVDVENMNALTKGILQELDLDAPDVIVAELGNGILGRYGVDAILKDDQIMKRAVALLVCASDVAGAFGAMQWLGGLGIRPSAFSGPCTDNSAGASLIEEKLGVTTVNALKDAEELGELALDAIDSTRKGAWLWKERPCPGPYEQG